MGGGSSSETNRRIQGLYATGPLGGLADAELLARFVDGDGLAREDAFTALVRRHGPMVLAVCRRMLGSSSNADVDDAFQAVFLVLARKAGSLRRPHDLRPWLYGAAVRAGKEARRRAARIRDREGTALDADRPAAAIDPDLFDLRAALDEELARLPGRYREPLLLCELEGASRRDAAERLGLAEGTLSSRLARGRSLLRDRLARRGLAVGALGAVLAPGSTSAAGLAALVDGSVRLALISRSVNSAGMVPAAVEAIAEGVTAMLAAACWKTTAALAATVAALGLTAGLAWGFAGPAATPDPGRAAEAVVEEPRPEAEPERKPDEVRLRGVVVDEAGRPIAGAEVLLGAFTVRETLATTGPDGSFAMDVSGLATSRGALLVRAEGGARLGFSPGLIRKTRAELEAPVRIVAAPGREVVARVAAPDGTPVVGAAVEALGSGGLVEAQATTGADGAAGLLIPLDAPVTWIAARKGGVGLDYAEFGDVLPSGTAPRPARATELPDEVPLKLAPARPVRIHVLDERGEPAPGVDLRFVQYRKEGLSSGVSSGTRGWLATTGTDGVALFDWLPKTRDVLIFFPIDPRYARRRVGFLDDDPAPAVLRLARNVPIRGRVVLPDGSPVKDARVHARGSGRIQTDPQRVWGPDTGTGSAYTDDLGRYVLNVPPDEMYAVWAEADGWASPSRMDVVVRTGKPAEDVDFQLIKGTLIRGVVTMGEDHRPADDVHVGVTENGGPIPAGLSDSFPRTTRRRVGAVTDEQGRYAFRIGPGTYQLDGPPRTESTKLVIADEPELVFNYAMPGPEYGPLEGRVVDPEGKAVAGAGLAFASVDTGPSIPRQATADGEGRFRVIRFLDRMFLRGRSPDGALAGLVEVGPDTPETILALAPAASVSGALVDAQGAPAPKARLFARPRIVLAPGKRPEEIHVEAVTEADAEGRFTLTGLPVGVEIVLYTEFPKQPSWGTAAVFRAEGPGPMELGTLKLDGYVPPPPPPRSLFADDAPDAGAVAPPIDAATLDGKPLRLEDFAGKFVLLEFWASWCGSRLGQTPEGKAAYEAFAKDDRLVVLGLSIDKTIDGPRKFQEEHKLPWTIGFLNGGEQAAETAYGVVSGPALVLIGPDGRIIARGMRGEGIKQALADALEGRRPESP